MPRLTLTFDNGPTPGVTDQVLDALGERDIKASFFVVGRQLARPGARTVAQRAHSEGHWIGNHTMTHRLPFGELADGPVLDEELEGAQRILGDLSHPDRLFRPYGQGGVLDERLLSPAAVDRLCAGGYTVVLWNEVPRDWEDTHGWPDTVRAAWEHRDWVVAVVHDLPTGAMDQLEGLLDAALTDGVELTQDFPDSVVPIRRGQLVGDLAGLVSSAGR